MESLTAWINIDILHLLACWPLVWNVLYHSFCSVSNVSCPLPTPTPALQLPLANDGGSRSSSSESSPQHHPYPSRPRHMLTLPTPPYGLQKSLEKYVDTDAWLLTFCVKGSYCINAASVNVFLHAVYTHTHCYHIIDPHTYIHTECGWERFIQTH